MRKFNGLLLIAYLSLLTPAVLAEVVPTQMNFQGVLTDTGGNPISDSTKSVQFTIHDAFSGGNILWSETLNVITDNQGRFTVILGQSWPLYGTVFSDTSRYLGVKVGSDQEIAPRAKISAVAYSLRTRSINGAIGGTLVGGNPGEGAVLFVDDGFGENGAILWGNPTGQGGSLYLGDEIGWPNAIIEPDVDGEGGFLSLYSQPSVSINGIYMDGNVSGQPATVMIGSSRFATFNMNNSGDGSVTLPFDAISSSEMLDEPGIAASSFNGGISLGAGYNVLSSRSITAPASGYVLAIGSCGASFDHTNGTASHVYYGVSNISNSFPPNQDQVTYFIPSSSATAQYGVPVTVHGLFTVGPGLHTFYLLGYENSGQASAYDHKLTLLFVPTAYGAVSSLASLESASPDQLQSEKDGLTEAEMKAELAEADAFNQARIQKELEQMQAQLDALKKQLAEDANFKRVGSSQK